MSARSRRRLAALVAVPFIAVGAIAGTAQAQRASGVPPTTFPPADGYDIDAVLRRSRELDAGRERSGPPDDKRYDAWSRRQETLRSRELETTRRHEAETRERLQSEQRRQTLQSMRPPSQQRSVGEQILDAETFNRVRNDAERARREADDAIPLLWRDKR